MTQIQSHRRIRRRGLQRVMMSIVSFLCAIIMITLSVTFMILNAHNNSQHDARVPYKTSQEHHSVASSLLPPRKMSSTSNPVYFIHVGKAGGSSLDTLMRDLLRSKYKGRRTYIGKKHYDWSYIQRRQHTQGYDVSANADVITMLRHPISRGISQFYFSKTLKWARQSSFVHKTLIEYLHNPENFRQPINDGESGVHFLAGTFPSKNCWVESDGIESEEKIYMRHNDTARAFRAAERLEQTVWFGLLEDVDRSMKLLQLTLDLDREPVFPKRNNLVGRAARLQRRQQPHQPRAQQKQQSQVSLPPPPTDEAIQMFEEYLPYDLWLYEYAQRLFEARWNYFTDTTGTAMYIPPEMPPLPKVMS